MVVDYFCEGMLNIIFDGVTASNKATTSRSIWHFVIYSSDVKVFEKFLLKFNHRPSVGNHYEDKTMDKSHQLLCL